MGIVRRIRAPVLLHLAPPPLPPPLPLEEIRNKEKWPQSEVRIDW